MRIDDTFPVGRPPEVVFDYVADPSNLADWQTSSVSVEPLTEGPLGVGSRFREHVKAPLGRTFVQVTELAEFERPTRLRVRVLEGPQPIDGVWTFAREDDATLVRFTAEGGLRGPLRVLEPLIRLLVRRRFATYHRNLRRNLEAG